MFDNLEPILDPVADFQKQLRKKSGALGLWGCRAYLRGWRLKDEEKDDFTRSY